MHLQLVPALFRKVVDYSLHDVGVAARVYGSHGDARVRVRLHRDRLLGVILAEVLKHLLLRQRPPVLSEGGKGESGPRHESVERISSCPWTTTCARGVQRLQGAAPSLRGPVKRKQSCRMRTLTTFVTIARHSLESELGSERSECSAHLIVAEKPHARRLVVLVVCDVEVVRPRLEDVVVLLGR